MRKRSHSVSTRDDNEEIEPYRHAQNLPDTDEGNIDPALSAGDSVPLPSRDTKRAELQREAEKMRRLLLEKERELAALGEEG